MSEENNKMQVDIENLFKQNVNDLSAIKELYRKLKEVEEKISQIKYIDSTLAYKLKKEYGKLKRIILDENASATLSNEIEIINTTLTNDIEPIITKLTGENKNDVIDITVYGGVGDGITDNSYALNMAKEHKKTIYFPQNASGNAIYYFSDNSFMDSNYRYYFENGVKISVPTTNGKSLKQMKLLSQVNIISRDRDNEGIALINDDLVRTNLADIDMNNYRKTNMSYVNSYEYVKLVAGEKKAGFINDDITLSENKFNFSSAIETGTNIIPSAIFEVSNNYSYESYFRIKNRNNLNTDLSRIRICIGCLDTDYNDFKMFSGSLTGNYYTSSNKGTWSDNVLKFNYFSSGYTLSDDFTSLILSCKVEDNKLNVYLNSVYMTTIICDSSISKCFIGFTNVTSDLSSNMEIGQVYSYLQQSNFYGREIKGFLLGDSLSYGEGSSISWGDILKNKILGHKGINNISITNYAVSGNTTNEQLTIFNTLNLSEYTHGFILLGTNDIQTQIPIKTFENNIKSILKKCNDNNIKVYLGIPSLWLYKTETGKGFESAHANRGGDYRSVLMRMKILYPDIELVDVMGWIGATYKNNLMLRDNLHYDSWVQLVVANCFANSIINSL